MSKKILLITENLGSGGAERQICGLAVMLTKAGYPCRLITYVENQFYEPYLRENKVDYELVPELYNKNYRVIRIARYVNKYNPDIVISYLPAVNITMCLAKLFIKAKLIVSERNNNIDITLKDRIQFNLYRLADVIVPNSNSQGNFISSNFRFLASKIVPIINFVDVKRFAPVARTKENDVLSFITVARYTSQKNVLSFLDVVKKIKEARLNVHFDWYGSKVYDKSYYSLVEEKFKMLDLADYMTLHAPCHEIEKLYQQSDVMCLPSLYEGYPNVVVEAMSSGLPVICSDRFENPFIVKDNINGFLFDPEDVDDIFYNIVKIANLSSNERKQMGVKNREACLGRNSEETFIQAYINLIENL